MNFWGNMPVPHWVPWIVVAFVAAQRAMELIVARRNTALLLARGAREVGGEHYPFIVGFHALWLGALTAWVWFYPPVLNAWCMGFYVLLQGARAWTIASLGPYWTTRIITVPDAPLVRRGPYRFLRHPNYVIVALEVAALPLALGAWPLAAGFTLVHAELLAARIRAENAALAQRS